MPASPSDPEQTFFISTPQGVFTASGYWFQATEEMLRSYAGPVLERVSLEELLRRAVRWLRSPQVLALWALPALLMVLSPLAAVLATLVLYAAWGVLSPSLASRHVARLWGLLDNVFLQGLYYVFMLSIVAAQGQYAAMAAGLVGFVAFRWGGVAWLLRPLLRPVQRALYALPVADQVLRAFILRAALEYGVDLPQIERLKERHRERRQERRQR